MGVVEGLLQALLFLVQDVVNDVSASKCVSAKGHIQRY